MIIRVSYMGDEVLEHGVRGIGHSDGAFQGQLPRDESIRVLQSEVGNVLAAEKW